MKESETGLAPDSTRAAFHAILTEAERGGIEIIELLNKDSTNISPLDWTTIAKAILERLDQFDGFVVAHGTDTMHFSASAVAFALGHPLSKPVVFTGSQTIPDVSHGDARINLLRAIEVACKEDLGEVVISFGDFVFRGSRAQKKDERKFDAFESPACPPLGEFIGDGIELFGASAPGPHLGDRHIDFARGVIQFSLIPGLEPELVLAAASHSKCQGVILQSFGAGNIPSEGQLSLGPVIRHIPATSPNQSSSQVSFQRIRRTRLSTRPDSLRLKLVRRPQAT